MPPLTYSVIRQIDNGNSRAMRRELNAIARRNLANKRARTARMGMARIAEAGRRIAPDAIMPPVRPADAPITSKTERKPRRVVRKATVTAPAPAAPVTTPAYARIPAAEIPAEIKAVCKLHRSKGDLSAEWFPVGVMPEGDDRFVFARLMGNSVRYAVA